MWGRDEERITETTYTQSYGGGGGPGGPPPLQPPYPWVSRWDHQAQRWLFVNEQTGESRWEFPGGGGGGYDERRSEPSYYGGPPARQYGQQTTTATYVEEDREAGRRQHGSGLGWGIAGAAAGLAGGALLMHEGHEIKEDWRRDEYRAEEGVDSASQWAGRRVGEVEDIPQDVEQGFDRFGNRVEQGWDNTVENVEDAPESLAHWGGEKVGDVERFDDRVEDSYDEGRYEGRNDYDGRDDRDDRW